MCGGHQEGGFTEETETHTLPKELTKLRKSMRASVDKIADSNTSLVTFSVAGGGYHQVSSSSSILSISSTG